MIFESVILSIIVGYCRKGRLKHMEQLMIKYWYLLSIAFLIQTAALKIPMNETFFYLLHLLSYGIIGIVTFINRRYISVAIMGIGTALNGLVIAVNSGQMPVKVPDYVLNPRFDRGHTWLTDETHLAPLADIIVTNMPVFSLRVFSVGDLILIVGAFILIQQGMVKKNLKKQETDATTMTRLLE